MADLVERLKAALADRYRVDRGIGRGGMALVFLTHDHDFDRPVALKAPRPGLAAVLETSVDSDYRRAFGPLRGIPHAGTSFGGGV